MVESFHRAGARSPEYALLGFLYEGPNHGYTLHRQLVSELGHIWHVSQSQTYNILKRLESQEYICASIQEQEKLPARQVLRITETGRRRFEEWLQASSGSSVRAIRLEFITRLYFGQKYFPDMLTGMITDETAEVHAALARLEREQKCIQPEQPFDRLGLELRIRQLYSVRDWLEECRKALEIKT